MEIVTREQARSLGKTRYFTGKSCKREHILQRTVSSRTCLGCQRLAANIPAAIAWNQARKANPATKATRRVRTLAVYGLTPESFALLVEMQSGRCALCGNARQLVVDHCHRSGRVRRLLCENCNKGLGFFNDESRLLQAAIDYLRSF
jgi:hypothetical protein